MLGRKNFLQLLLPVLFLWVFYTIFNRVFLVEEHLTDTPMTIKQELKKTNDKIDALAKEFHDMNTNMSAQADQAAAAKASISAIHKS
jgi:hypothetical protein